VVQALAEAVELVHSGLPAMALPSASRNHWTVDGRRLGKVGAHARAVDEHRRLRDQDGLLDPLLAKAGVCWGRAKTLQGWSQRV